MTSAESLPDNVLSIAGEQFEERRQRHTASRADVERYHARASDRLKRCRDRGGVHLYGPPVPVTSRTVHHYTDQGELVIYSPPCLDCGCAYQELHYRSIWVKRGRKREREVEWLYSVTRYQLNSDGESYLNEPGHGRMLIKDTRSVLATERLGHDAATRALLDEAAATAQAYEREHGYRGEAAPAD